LIVQHDPLDQVAVRGEGKRHDCTVCNYDCYLPCSEPGDRRKRRSAPPAPTQTDSS